jgi:hypothetical protein
MKVPRRKLLRLAAGAAVLPAVVDTAAAETYPTCPVRLVVGYPAGGTPDFFARLIGNWLSERLGQSFVIDNRPGAATNIATREVATGRLHAALSECTEYDQCNTLPESRFQFHQGHRTGRKHLASYLNHGGQPIIPGQDGSRVHRLR